ncbi:helix-turn-helix domain-containing protein [Streptomyces canus]|uniref:helix-turn-helix domain-containing protein n=1 Tax=Streptomyces canus TaxID=58343 RepID=UPI00340A3768
MRGQSAISPARRGCHARRSPHCSRNGQGTPRSATSQHWRMYRVKVLLRETPLSVQEIAVRVGYDTGTALSRAFSKREGISPGAWRRAVGAPEASSPS